MRKPIKDVIIEAVKKPSKRKVDGWEELPTDHPDEPANLQHHLQVRHGGGHTYHPFGYKMPNRVIHVGSDGQHHVYATKTDGPYGEISHIKHIDSLSSNSYNH
jgi:hypothetical protein